MSGIDLRRDMLTIREKAMLYQYGRKSTRNVAECFGISENRVRDIVLGAVNKILANENKPQIKGLKQIDLTWDDLNPYIDGIEVENLPEKFPSYIKSRNATLEIFEMKNDSGLKISIAGKCLMPLEKHDLKLEAIISLCKSVEINDFVKHGLENP